MPAPKNDRIAGIILAVFIMGMLGVFASLGVFSSPPSAAAPARSGNNSDCATNSFAYMLALKEGDSIASAYWKPGVTPKRLFDVRNFEKMKQGPLLTRNGERPKVPSFFYEYSVESSTKGGFPIHKRWAVIMELSQNYGGRSCAIVDLREAE